MHKKQVRYDIKYAIVQINPIKEVIRGYKKPLGNTAKINSKFLMQSRLGNQVLEYVA